MQRLYLIGMLVALVLSACAPPATPAPTAVADPRSAIVGEFSGTVNGRASAAEALAPVTIGFQLKVTGEVQTGEASKARLDFSDQSILRLAANSSFVLQEVSAAENGGVFTQLELAFGKVWASLTGGALEVKTPVGVASVRGSFAVIQFVPGDPANPDDDLMVIDCLEGSCTAGNAIVVEQAGNLERLVVGRTATLRQQLTQADVEAFLRENPESTRLVATLTAAPPATLTPTATASATTAATATATNTPTPAASETSTPVPATATPAVLGAHVVRSGESLLCIGRGYGVAPEAIAAANNLDPAAQLRVGANLNIPAVPWTAITPGPTCAPQFQSPYRGLPPSTATATRAIQQVTPTVTPSATASGVPQITFTVDRTTIVPGECVTVSWAVLNVSAVFLNGQGVVGNGAQQFCLQETTTFTLRVVLRSGAFEDRQLTVTVTPVATRTPTITLTPTPDQQGPAISNLVPNPAIVDAPNTGCQVTFSADISDLSGVTVVTVNWTAVNVTGQSKSGSVGMQYLSGTTWQGGWTVSFNPLFPYYGTVNWSVTAYDGLRNVSTVSSPTTITVQPSGGGCL